MSNTRYDNMSKAPNTPKGGLIKSVQNIPICPFTKSNGKPNLNVTSKKPVSLRSLILRRRRGMMTLSLKMDQNM